LPFFLGREHREAGFEVGQHGAAAGGEKAVGFVEDDKAHAAEPADGVFAGSFDVFSETAGGGDDDVRAGG
jgi:hypothetical protein